MKKRDLKKLALLGLTSGILIANQSSAEAKESPISNNESSLLIAHNNCNGPGGCGTAHSHRRQSGDQIIAEADPVKKTPDNNDGNLGYHLMSEKELLMELNGSGAALYKSLDPKGKEMARLVASQRCNGTNECKGLNACQTDHNECAGKGSCKNTSKCALADKNLAVKLVADKLKQKRSTASAD